MATEMDTKQIQDIFERLHAAVSSVIVGKSDAVGLAVASLFAGGHVLIEDVPGTGKTMLAKTLAASIGGVFKRIQFTPDLLPSDITGVNVFNMKTTQFEFLPGPVFANIVLADEINRATPKTQAGILECMEERQVTTDGVTRPLGKPFMVIATQNPIDTQGVFPLPEAQLDRFLIQIPMSYPDTEASVELLKTHRLGNPLAEVKAVVSPEEIAEAQQTVPGIYVTDDLYRYIVAITEATRSDERILLGVSPRGSLNLLRFAQALAACAGRDYVLPDDIKTAVPSVYSHRLMLIGTQRLRKNAAKEILREILDVVPVPTERIKE